MKNLLTRLSENSILIVVRNKNNKVDSWNSNKVIRNSTKIKTSLSNLFKLFVDLFILILKTIRLSKILALKMLRADNDKFVRGSNNGKNKKKVWLTLYLGFDIIAGLVISIFKTSFLTKLLENFLILVIVKDNMVESSCDKVDKTDKVYIKTRNYQRLKNLERLDIWNSLLS